MGVVKTIGMVSISFLVAIAVACTKNIATTAPVTPGTPAVGVNKTLMLQLVNDARKKGCHCGDAYYPPAPAVGWNDLLEKAAQNHSKDMYQKKYFSHSSSDGTGAGARISAAGYTWRYYGENIAMGYNNEREVVAGWLKSPGHCKNIMSKNFSEMGVANVGGYWTQDFGSR